jgi:hypothetical protein
MVNDEHLPLGWASEAVPLHSYVSFYYSQDETLRRSLAFIRAGLHEPGTFCAVLADAARHPTVVEEPRGEAAWGEPGWPDLSALKQCEAQVNRVAARYRR